jgi:hypothetical protein
VGCDAELKEFLDTIGILGDKMEVPTALENDYSLSLSANFPIATHAAKE